MAGFLGILFSLINVAVLILGAYYIFFAEDVSEASSINECLRDRASTIQWTGAISSFVATVGIVGACFKVKPLQVFYIVALLIAISIAIVYCMFVSSMMPAVPAETIYYNTAESKYWLEEYGPMMQKVIANEKDFNATKQCFQYIDTCRIMANQSADQKLSYLDYGCCQPPNRCGLVQAPYTGLWVVVPKGLNSSDDECKEWAKMGKNCYDCDSCKAAYLAVYQEKWNKNTSSRIECVIMLMGTLILSYYVFMHDHYRYRIGDTVMHHSMFSSSGHDV